MKLKINLFYIFTLCFFIQKINSYFPLNLTSPYDFVHKTERKNNSKLKLDTFFQTGFNSVGYSILGQPKNPFKTHSNVQNSISMLNGFLPNSEIGKLASIINIDQDQSNRGQFDLSGDIKIPLNLGVSLSWFFSDDWSLSLSVPFYKIKVDNISWVDLTENVTYKDAITKEYLTNNFKDNVKKLSNGLSLNGWDSIGFGDTFILCSWKKSFEQQRDFLKKVTLNSRSGIGFATGIKKDVDNAFSFSVASDGSSSVPFGAGIDLNFLHGISFGLDADFLYSFESDTIKRIKTHRNQTDFLLLQKAYTTTNYGMTQKFTIYSDSISISGIDLKLIYQYTKHSKDDLFVTSSEFSSSIANTSKTLDEWTAHSAIFKFNLDLDKILKKENYHNINLGLFAKIPFNGKNSIQITFIGASAAINF